MILLHFTRGLGNLASDSLERTPPDRGLLELVSSVFNAARLDAALIGGEARNLWRAPRLTYDLDFTVRSNRDAITRSVQLLLESGFRIVRNQDPQTSSGPDFVQLYNEHTHHLIEIQTAKTAYQSSIIERGIPIEGLEPIRVARAEDLVVLKLIAFRRKDRNDLVELAQVPTIDWEYVEKWAEEWDVTDRLQQLREWLREDESI